MLTDAGPAISRRVTEGNSELVVRYLCGSSRWVPLVARRVGPERWATFNEGVEGTRRLVDHVLKHGLWTTWLEGVFRGTRAVALLRELDPVGPLVCRHACARALIGPGSRTAGDFLHQLHGLYVLCRSQLTASRRRLLLRGILDRTELQDVLTRRFPKLPSTATTAVALSSDLDQLCFYHLPRDEAFRRLQSLVEQFYPTKTLSQAKMARVLSIQLSGAQLVHCYLATNT